MTVVGWYLAAVVVALAVVALVAYATGYDRGYGEGLNTRQRAGRIYR